MAILRSMWDMDLEATYDMLRRPALALVAVPAQSRAEQRQLFETRRASLERLRARCPLLEVQWSPDTIHDLPLQRPALLAEAIARIARP